jgi:hypothetical protein
LVEALIRFTAGLLIERTQPEFKVALMIGRQFHADFNVRVHFVGLDDGSLAVFTSIFMRTRLQTQRSCSIYSSNNTKSAGRRRENGRNESRPVTFWGEAFASYGL